MKSPEFFSEPLANAEVTRNELANVARLLKECDSQRQRANSILENSPDLPEEERTRLTSYIASLDSSYQQMSRDYMNLNQTITQYINEHLRYQDILNNFQPKIEH